MCREDTGFCEETQVELINDYLTYSFQSIVLLGEAFMKRKFLFGRLLMVFAVAGIVLIVGCDRKESMESVEKGRYGAINEEPKQVDVGLKKVKLETSMGDIVIELDEQVAPVTVENFLRYVQEHFYDGTIFHRVIPNFMVQGGGFTPDMKQKETHEPIVNEASNGLKNDRGTIAMARTPHPDSATSQFFINHKDNNSLNYAGPGKPGYAVFGRVVKGMKVVDKIAKVQTTRRRGHADVPVVPVVIKSARVVSSN